MQARRFRESADSHLGLLRQIRTPRLPVGTDQLKYSSQFLALFSAAVSRRFSSPSIRFQSARTNGIVVTDGRLCIGEPRGKRLSWSVERSVVSPVHHGLRRAESVSTSWTLCATAVDGTAFRHQVWGDRRCEGSCYGRRFSVRRSFS
jgi:hypothetical protein